LIFLPLVFGIPAALFHMRDNGRSISQTDLITLSIFLLLFMGFAWKKKGFIIDMEGVKYDPQFIDETKVLYGAIERVYVEQDSFDVLLKIATVCIVAKYIPTLLDTASDISNRTIRISGLSPQDAHAVQGIIESRLLHLNASDTARARDDTLAKADGQLWLVAVTLSILVPWFLGNYIIGTPGKSIIFIFIHPFIVWWSYVKWKRLFGSLALTPQISYFLTVLLIDVLALVILKLF